MYYAGEGGAADQAAAREWYRRAARQGYTEAHYMLARMHYGGEGGVADPPRAREWYERAAKRGHAEAQFNVALMYYEGEGGGPDNELAYAWFHAAAEQGDATAARYRESLGVAPDWLEGASLAEARELADVFYEMYVEPFRWVARQSISEGIP